MTIKENKARVVVCHLPHHGAVYSSGATWAFLYLMENKSTPGIHLALFRATPEVSTGSGFFIFRGG